MTKVNSPGLIPGHNINKKFGDEMAKTKLICVSELPFGVGTSSVSYGEIFEEEGMIVKILIGDGRAVLNTPENLEKYGKAKTSKADEKKK